MTEQSPDEIDLAIVDAIRTAPRATWQELAAVLRIDPATVSRRWNRLENNGVAWVTAHLSGAATPVCAWVELDCAPGQAAAVATRLAPDVEAATIKLTSGARDVVVLVQARTLEELSTYLLERLGTVPGITHVRSHLTTESRVDGSRWRDGALDPQQRRLLESARSSTAGSRATLQAPDYGIARALGLDGRMSLESLAEQTGLSRSAAGRRLTALCRAGLLTFRCDTSHHLTDRRVSTVHLGRYDAESLTDLEVTLRAYPGVRAVSVVAGPHNVVIDARVRTIEEIQSLEAGLRRSLPGLRIDDRFVVFRMVKHLGRIVDTDGHSIGVVPLVHPR